MCKIIFTCYFEAAHTYDVSKDRINYTDFFMTMIWWNADTNQIVTEAKKRWLRPVEICEILQNYKSFHIASEPANMPPSMTLNCIALVCYC